MSRMWFFQGQGPPGYRRTMQEKEKWQKSNKDLWDVYRQQANARMLAYSNMLKRLERTTRGMSSAEKAAVMTAAAGAMGMPAFTRGGGSGGGRGGGRVISRAIPPQERPSPQYTPETHRTLAAARAARETYSPTYGTFTGRSEQAQGRDRGAMARAAERRWAGGEAASFKEGLEQVTSETAASELGIPLDKFVKERSPDVGAPWHDYAFGAFKPARPGEEYPPYSDKKIRDWILQRWLGELGRLMGGR